MDGVIMDGIITGTWDGIVGVDGLQASGTGMVGGIKPTMVMEIHITTHSLYLLIVTIVTDMDIIQIDIAAGIITAITMGTMTLYTIAMFLQEEAREIVVEVQLAHATVTV